MPELPEVETVRRTLEPLLAGKKITGVDVRYGGIIKNMEAGEFSRLLKNKTIAEIGRRGKYLLLELSDGYTIVIHLRMTGQLIFTQVAEPEAKHTHIIFHLPGKEQLRFVDIRKFGLLFLVKKGEWEQCGGLARLGPEPLSGAFTLQAWSALLAGQKGGLKAFLLNQAKVAGIGNIYADEILFEAGLHPQKRVETLESAEIAALHAAIVAKLSEGVACRGTSISDYVDGQGEKGGFQERLQVYDQKGRPCPRCGTLLVKAVIAGRGTVCCPYCQRR